MIKVKTFIHAIKSISVAPLKAKNYLQDKRLSKNEKIILNCFLKFRDNNLDEIIEDLEQITECSDPVVESQKQLLLGLTLTNKSQFTEATVHMEKALELIQKQGLPYFEYLITYNLFIISFNQKNKKQMQKHVAKLKALPIDKDVDQVMILRCLLNYHTFNGDFSKAQELVEEIESNTGFYKLTESDAISYLIDKINLSIKQDDFKQSFTILNEMKKFRKFHLTENFKFLKILLDNLINNSPIYFTDDHFSRIPLLLYQMKVIRSLEEGKKEDAVIYWKKLSHLYPDLYGADFTFTGDKCLFSICMNKHLKKIQVLEEKIDLPDSSQHDKILSILEKAEVPISRDFLFQAVYGKEAETKEDYQRLSKVIYRLKVKLNIDISLKKGCYFLEKSKQAA